MKLTQPQPPVAYDTLLSEVQPYTKRMLNDSSVYNTRWKTYLTLRAKYRIAQWKKAGTVRSLGSGGVMFYAKTEKQIYKMRGTALFIYAHRSQVQQQPDGYYIFSAHNF